MTELDCSDFPALLLPRGPLSLRSGKPASSISSSSPKGSVGSKTAEVVESFVDSSSFLYRISLEASSAAFLSQLHGLGFSNA